MSKLKLFVVGESSGNPENWSEWGDRAFVIASNEEEALLLVGDLCGPSVVEVSCDKPILLHYEPVAPDRF
jgi:hypothetical protein